MRVRVQSAGCNRRVALRKPADREQFIATAKKALAFEDSYPGEDAREVLLQNPGARCTERFFLQDGCEIGFDDIAHDDVVIISWSGKTMNKNDLYFNLSSAQHAHLLKLGLVAKEKLRPWLSADPPFDLPTLAAIPFYVFLRNNLFGDSGKWFGLIPVWESIGAVTALAALDSDGDGQISASEFKQYTKAAELAIQSARDSSLNFGVIAALALSVAVPMAVEPIEVSDKTANLFDHGAIRALEILYGISVQLMVMIGIGMLYDAVKLFLAVSNYCISTDAQIAYLISSPVILGSSTKKITLLGGLAQAAVMFGTLLFDPVLGFFHLFLFFPLAYGVFIIDNHNFNCWLMTHQYARSLLGY